MSRTIKDMPERVRRYAERGLAAPHHGQNDWLPNDDPFRPLRDAAKPFRQQLNQQERARTNHLVRTGRYDAIRLHRRTVVWCWL